MRTAAALLAAALLAVLTGCGDDGGAEPGASKDATLVLDFQPNAVHSGIYSALEQGFYEDEGVRLRVREPSESSDAPKLLRAGRTQFAIMDIHDVGIAIEKGFDLAPLMPVVQVPLAAVIARDGDAVRSPKDLEGKTVGVTGLPSDDAVLDSVLEAGGADPAAVKRVTIGFNAVAALRAGKIDAATAFWNAEGVALRRAGLQTREFRVDDFGAPRYPELMLVTTGKLAREQRPLVKSVTRGTKRGYRFAASHQAETLRDLLTEVAGLDAREQRSQLAALDKAQAFKSPPGCSYRRSLDWLRWDYEHGILRQKTLSRHRGPFKALVRSICY